MEAFSRQEYREAISLFQDALKESGSAECWNDLGCAQFACKLPEDAASSFHQALKLDPSYAQAAQNLGMLLLSQGKNMEALAVLRRGYGLAAPNDREMLAPLIAHCLRESRVLTQPPFQWGTRAPKLLCMVTGLIERGFTEANAREAWTLFESLREPAAEFQASFASIELNVHERTYDSKRQILGIPQADVARFVRENSPDLLQVHTPLISFPIEYELQHQPMILTVTANDPLEGCSDAALEELRHLIDYGRLAIVCQSSGSNACLDRRDIRVAAVIPPVVEPPPKRMARTVNRTELVVGFATTPLVPEHWESRGIPLLLDLAAASPETQFMLAWRGSPEKIQEAVAARSLKNVKIRAGVLEMEEFYENIDAIVLPFAKARGNHGCPLSAVEGMLRGKPVLATELAGIAEWIEGEGAGVVVPPTVEGLQTGLNRLQSEIREFGEQARVSARSHFDRSANVAVYRQLHLQMLEKHKGPTLRDWQMRVEAAGKNLVRGRPALAKFYGQQAVAERYIEDRFSASPSQQFEEQERDAIRRLISSKFGKRTDLNLLDLATGPGRLLACLVPFGATTALDGSEAMLNVARQRNLPGVEFVHGDAFHQSLARQFHVITCGRLLRHLEYPDRRILYRRFAELLRDDGIAIVDVPNRAKEHQFRDAAGWENFQIYDVFWTLNEFREELKENGLRLVSFESAGARLSIHPDQPENDEPIEYVAAFEKMRS